VLRKRVKAIAEARNRALNTPKTRNIADLFEEAVGLTKVTSSWTWSGMQAAQA
jgi:hypothetical protein